MKGHGREEQKRVQRAAELDRPPPVPSQARHMRPRGPRPLAMTLAVIAAAVSSVPVSALAAGEATEEAPRAVSFEIGSGVQYDSNVAVLDLDTSANAGDAAALLELGVGYDTPRSGPVGFQAGYNFSQSLHEDFDEFDVGIHRGSASVSLDLEKLDTGAMLQYARASLDGEEFLVLTQVSPYVSKLVGQKLFLRFAYAYSDKEFATNPGRAARADSVSADTFVFLNGLETYLVLGVRYDEEDAIDGQFDYTGHKLRAQLSRRIALGARRLTLKAQLRYETRDYERPTLSIGAPRNDDRYQFEATAELPIGERVVTAIGYKYADNRSNLSSVDFEENVIAVRFIAGW